MKKLTILLALFGIIFNSCLVPPASEENSIETTGTVIDISEGSSFDVKFTLQDDDNIYYINRGLENGLTIDGLKEQLLEKEVSLKYSDMPIDLSTHHLYEVKIGDKLIYSEMPEKS